MTMNRISLRAIFIFSLGTLLLFGVLLGQNRQKKRYDQMAKNVGVKVATLSEYKPFVIVVCSYNNADYVEQNLSSAISQVYPNFRVIYVDDASTDDTLDRAEKLIAHFGMQDQVTVVANPNNYGAVANFYSAIHSCRNDEVVVVLDGDDQLAHERVLEELNYYYNNPNIWMTYGQAKAVNDPALAQSKPMSHFLLKSGRIKKKGWVTSHPRTFYAGLFKKIKLEDFTYRGRFLPMACDVAMMLPMVEMAREHTAFIPDILYLYNDSNPINDHKKSAETQEFFNQYVRALPVYEKLTNPPWHEDDLLLKHTSDVMTFSYNRPLQLYAFLESLEQYAKNVENIFVIYRASNELFEAGYEKVKQRFENVEFIQQSDAQAKKEFKPLVLKYGFHPHMSDAQYITFSTDDLVLKDYVDFSEGIERLEKTKAHAYFYRLGKHVDYCYMLDRSQSVPPLMRIEPDLFAWEYEQGEGDWQYPNSVDFTLYRKSDIYPEIKEIDFTYPNDLEGIWASRADMHRLGLCSRESKIVNMPLNVISNEFNRATNNYSVDDLLEKFMQGMKMDLMPLHKIQNRSPHIDYEPMFVMRGDE